MVAAHISVCLTDISCWMKCHNPQLKFSIKHIRQPNTLPQLLPTRRINHNPFQDNPEPCSCNWWSFNSLSKLLFYRGWTIVTLFWSWLPACTLKPLELIHNAAARVAFNEPKRAHITPHFALVANSIKFKALMFANRTTTGSAPLYLNTLLETYSMCLPPVTFTLTVPCWWNDLPNSTWVFRHIFLIVAPSVLVKPGLVTALTYCCPFFFLIASIILICKLLEIKVSAK